MQDSLLFLIIFESQLGSRLAIWGHLKVEGFMMLRVLHSLQSLRELGDHSTFIRIASFDFKVLMKVELVIKLVVFLHTRSDLFQLNAH